MLYMIIETYWPGSKEKIAARLEQKGRMLPKGLRYVNSWLEQSGNRSFQLMETEDRKLFATWTAKWRDLVEFMIIPVEESPLKKRESDAPAADRSKATRK